MNSIEEAWRNLLEIVIKDGYRHEKDDGDILQEHLINHCFIPNVLNEFGNQNITTKLFLSMLKQGKFNISDYPFKDEALYDYVKSMDDIEIITNKNKDGTDKFTYTYPQRIFNMSDRESDFMVNQFDVMCSRLKGTRKKESSDELEMWSGSNRAVANIYSGVKDYDMKDIPCLQILQATIRDNNLVLHCFFRSNDLFGAFPSNMFFLNYLGLKLVDALKDDYPLLRFKGINYNSSSLHIYEADLKMAKKVLE